MRHLLPTLALLAVAITIPTPAHADVDDFVLTSAHHIYSFSLTTPYYPNPISGHGLVNFNEFGPGSVDGVPGYTLGGYFYVNQCCGRSGIDFSLPDGTTYQLTGPDLGGYATPFLTGTFHYTDFPYDFNPNLVLATDGPYTLTVTPETSTSVTPEPASFALLATGTLGFLTCLRRRFV